MLYIIETPAGACPAIVLALTLKLKYGQAHHSHADYRTQRSDTPMLTEHADCHWPPAPAMASTLINIGRRMKTCA